MPSKLSAYLSDKILTDFLDSTKSIAAPESCPVPVTGAKWVLATVGRQKKPSRNTSSTSGNFNPFALASESEYRNQFRGILGHASESHTLAALSSR